MDKVDVAFTGLTALKTRVVAGPATQPLVRRYRGVVTNYYYYSFGCKGSKGASGNKLTWGYLKDAKADFESPSKS
jgi:hypothetical protein